LEALLEGMAVGRKFKQRRKTLSKQWHRLQSRLQDVRGTKGNGAPGLLTSTPRTHGDDDAESDARKCRNCNEPNCGGACWGFHGLARKHKLDALSKPIGAGPETVTTTTTATTTTTTPLPPPPPLRKKRQSANKRNAKILQNERAVAEMKQLQLAAPPSQYYDPETHLRTPPPRTRVLRSAVKGAWVGRTVEDVLREQFFFHRDEGAAAGDNVGTARFLLRESLIKVNDATVTDPHFVLKNGQELSRVCHWHEPPVLLPSSPVLVIQRKLVPDDGGGGEECGRRLLYVVSKPCTVPVHPGGPYLSNSLTIMAEAQLGLEPRSLLPCHRLDRVTSGVLICATRSDVVGKVRRAMEGGNVRKLYVARVVGRFPPYPPQTQKQREEDETSTPYQTWHNNTLKVTAPIKTTPNTTTNNNSSSSSSFQNNPDITTFQRTVCPKEEGGKPSVTHFQFLSYNPHDNTSLVAVIPRTGRSHQIRVHASYIRFPICHDVLYGAPAAASFHCSNETTAVDDGVSNNVIKALDDSLLLSSTTMTVNGNDDGKGEAAANVVVEGVTRKEVDSAERTCPCREGRWEELFNDAQLLRSGHRIDLHAFKYWIKFDGKDETEEEMLFEAALPLWAQNSLGGDVKIDWNSIV